MRNNWFLIYAAFLVLSIYRKVVEAQYGYQGLSPPGCDIEAALQCEYDFLKCKLFTGPAGDAQTLCTCGEYFYGDCIRRAGCELYPQVDVLSTHQIYLKNCIEHIIKNDCPSPLMCAINCASDGSISIDDSMIIPFNNYGTKYSLRIRICRKGIHQDRYNKYARIEVVPCQKLSDFDSCARWIPPNTFVPVALPKNTTYVEVDSCELIDDEPVCLPKPVRIYGNQLKFPRTFDVPQSEDSICDSNDDCLGTYCDTHFHPHICSPKTLKHALRSGKYYLSDPFS